MTDNRDKSSNTNTSSSVSKSYIKANYIEEDMEEDIDMKNQYRIKNHPTPNNLDDCVSKRFTDSNYVKITDFDANSIVRNRNMNFNSVTFTDLDSIYVNRDPSFDLEPSTKFILIF